MYSGNSCLALFYLFSQNIKLGLSLFISSQFLFKISNVDTNFCRRGWLYRLRESVYADGLWIHGAVYSLIDSWGLHCQV